MKTTKRVVFAVIAAGVIMGLAGCPSPFLTAIKKQIAQAPFTGSNYSFARQWGNPLPQYSFYATEIVRTDTIGDVYVADSSTRLRKFDGSGNLLSTVNLKAYTVFETINDVSFDASGNMFLLDSKPEIQQYDINGNYLNTFTYGSFTYNPVALCADGSYVYVVDYANIYKFTYSGSFVGKYSGPFNSVALVNANSIATDGTYLYVLDSGNNRVVQTDLSGNYQNTWGGSTAFSGASGITVQYGTVYVVDTNNGWVDAFSTFGSPLSYVKFGSGLLTTPNSVAVDNAGSIYVTDKGGDVNGTWEVQKYTGTTPSHSATWAETSLAAGNGVFGNPSAITFDSSGNIYVADAEYSRVEEFTSTGGFIRQWGSQGSGTGQFASGIFAWGMAVDSNAKKVYVPDMSNNRVEVFDMTGVYKNSLIPGGAIPSFSSPSSAAVDSNGNVYITDEGNARVVVFSSSGLYVKAWGGSNGGTPTPGKFSTPIGIAVDSSNNVYVSDFFGNNVQKLDTNGNPISEFGSGSIATLGSGPGQFSVPAGVAVDPYGNLFVTDLGNRRVQKFDPAGNFMGQLGGVGVGNGGFGLTLDVAVTPSGQVVVTDYYSCLVDEFNPTF